MISASKPRSRNRCRNTTALPPSPYVPITSGSTSPIRTVESATGQRSLKLKERGVVGDDLDVSRRAGRDGLNGVVHQRVFDPRVAQPYCQIGAALARGHHRMVDEMLEVDVPQPRKVLAVGHLAVDRDHH